MPPARSTQRLRNEHDLIERIVDALAHLPQPAERGVSSVLIAGMIAFLSRVIDRFHCAKEELALFPVLNAHGLPLDSGPLAALRTDHGEERRLLGALGDAVVQGVAPGTGPGVLDLADAFVALVRSHLQRENDEVLPYADRVLSESEDARIEEGFARVERETVGAHGRDALYRLVEAVEQASHSVETLAGATAAAPVAADVMRADVPRLKPEMSLALAAELMGTAGVRDLPVLSAERLVGIVTERDMQPHRGHFEWTPVRVAMTPDPHVVGRNTPVETVARQLLQWGFNSVPVVADGAYLGMVSRRDLLRVVATQSSSLGTR
jgi:CBS domain-containing protein